MSTTSEDLEVAAPAWKNQVRGEQVRVGLDRAVAHLLGRQEPPGWWQGELETNVTMDAEDLLMRQFLGVRTPEQTEQTASFIRSRQRVDGSWANFFGGPADVSTTAEAYVALRLAGDDPDVPHLVAARRIIAELGGLPATRVFTRFWLALFGQWPWSQLPVLPPEMVFLPRWFPLNLYDFACWARQTIAPLTMLSALQPVRALGVSIEELHALGGAAPKPSARTGWDRAFALLDRGLHGYHRVALAPLRRRALQATARWIEERQEADGSWGGIQPPWVYSLMALHAFGVPLDAPVLAGGLAGWERFTIREDSPDGSVRRIEACQSPVWDTALALVALGDAGVSADHPAMERAADWLLAEEITVRGDWAVRRAAAPGGWAFEFDNDLYPDVDDTAEVVLALRHVRNTPERSAAVARGIAWVQAMRSRDGGFAAFDADNTREVAYRLPFCDFGAVIDPPTADVTAHVLEMLALTGAPPAEQRQAADWLRERQEADGSWFGRWGCNYVYGIGAVVPALVAAGEPLDGPVVRRAVDWLIAHQNDDGGWGEDLRSYSDPTWAGHGTSTASQTAWALLALLAAGEAGHPATSAGVGWLLATQRSDGGWDEPEFTGTGFPGDFFINYHLYRLVFPVSALGRYARAVGERP